MLYFIEEKKHFFWINDGICVADGADPTCGPGKQNQTRGCKDGPVGKCTTGDKIHAGSQTISCDVAWSALPPCGKLWQFN